MNAETQKPVVELVEVEVVVDCRVNGQDYKAGSKVQVYPRTKEKLAERGWIR